MNRAVLSAVLVLLTFEAHAQDDATTMEVLPRSSDSFILTTAAPSASRPVVVDGSRRVDITVTALSADLDVTLISPRKTRYSVGQTRSDFDSWIAVMDGIGANYRAIITNPASGTWTLEVGGRKLAADVPVVVNTFLQSEIFVSVVAGDIEHRVGDFAAISLAAFDGPTRLRGFTIAATLLNPSGTTSPATFRDDGAEADFEANDGIYTALVELLLEGDYEVTADVSGIVAANEFHRSGSATLRARKATATLTGTFIDAAVDDDDDGLDDAITVSPAVNVTEAGTYVVTVTLRSASRETIQKTTMLDLLAGSAHPLVRFEADRIKDVLAEDGPYAVESILLERRVPKDVVFVDRRSEAGFTRPYQLQELQRPRLRLMGSPTSTAVDRNGNGLFDELTVEVNLETELDGSYSFSGTLFNDTGSLGLASREMELEAGSHTITLTFEGGPIGRQALDGPYEVNFTADGPLRARSLDTVFKTSALSASRFEGFVPDTTPPVLTVSVSPNVLWPPDHRLVEITPTIRATDDRDPSPGVHLDSITTAEGQQQWTPSAPGDGDIKVENGKIFLRATRFGHGPGRSYILTWTASDVRGNHVSSSTTVTVPHDQGE